MVFKQREFISVFIISISCLWINLVTGTGINRDETAKSHDFDILIFTERWPITDCMTWMNKGPEHVCALPSQKDTWIIHGVWPTKFGTLGPFFCNESAPFDINALQPIMDQLKQYWMNIEKGTPEAQLWQHEWLKHGTCASVIEALSTENKYFGQGLSWLQQYTMTTILEKANIQPGSHYKVVDFHNAVKSALNVNPSIHCVHEKGHSGDQYLAEIKICFNKQLELVNCNGVLKEDSEYDGDVITNCNPNEEINYPSTLPQYLLDKADRSRPIWRFPWINFYKLIQMIKWFTL